MARRFPRSTQTERRSTLVATRRDAAPEARSSLTGVTLALGTRWGLLRYPRVIAKLVLIVSVIVVGATVLRPVLDDNAHLDDTALIAGAGYDVAALTLATALAVFKPGRLLRSRARGSRPYLR